MRDFSRNNQPHFQSRTTAYSLTFLLFDAVTGPQLEKLRKELLEEIHYINGDALPHKALRKAKAQSRNFEKLELLLASKRDQSHLLKNPAAAAEVGAYFEKFDGELYTLHAYSVMSNHAHALLDLSPQLDTGISEQDIEWPIDRLIGRLKGGSAFVANRALHRRGTLWMTGYHDRYIRSEEHFIYNYNYILNNPVAAGLVSRWEDHPATWGRGNRRVG